MIQAPCKDCKRKGCGEYHAQCEAYQTFLRENNQSKETIRTAKHRDRISSGAWYARNKKGGKER